MVKDVSFFRKIAELRRIVPVEDEADVANLVLEANHGGRVLHNLVEALFVSGDFLGMGMRLT